MKKYVWALWVVPLLLFGLAVVATLVILAIQPTDPGATSPVPAKLQLVAAVVAPLGAVFTTVGVGVALFVAIRDSRRFAREESRRRREDTERRADQARLVQLKSRVPEMPDETTRAVFEVQNFSTSTIFDLTCEIETSVANRMDPSPEFPTGLPVHLYPQVSALKPGETWTWSRSWNAEDIDEAISTTFVAFTDAAGVRWVRFEGQPPVLADPAQLHPAATLWVD
ncbi:hypothetical protein [Rhodococcus sp. NPDC057529]|uniref:hypothetical protein n=1 Tax=Rhodococcus sp. NPDC057529 TaxID=3346158 RepID=UPI00366E91F8